jgi:signal transduction histidine kinase
VTRDDQRRLVDLAVAVRRIVVGYRGVAAGWLCLLCVAAWAGGRLPLGLALALGALALGWAALTAGVAAALVQAEAPARWAAVAADVLVAGATLLVPAWQAPEAASVAGGFPFSAVVVAGWLRGLPAALAAAAALTAAQVVRGVLAQGTPEDVLSTLLFYGVAAAVLAWGMGVLERTAAERDATAAALAAERADRALAEERARTAAHLHDSVLQTLALIQRRSDDPDEVARLARSQERSLRDWLAGRPVGADAAAPDRPATLKVALDEQVAEVEALHRITVEVVQVGDAPLDAGGEALVAAAREAMVNAAKHAGVAQVDVFAEVDPSALTVFVRDRGAGFDPTAVPPDRSGLRGSITERMRTAGGEAVVRSTPGAGTEVELRLPRSAPAVAGGAP